MIFAIASSCFIVGICVGAYLNEVEQYKRKFKAKAPRTKFLD